jgi:hypothetical protein
MLLRNVRIELQLTLRNTPQERRYKEKRDSDRISIELVCWKLQ